MFRTTSNSGAVDGDGDLRNKNIIVECKDECGDAIKFPYSHLVKIRQQCRNHNKRYWMRFFRNGRGDKVVSMNYELAEMLMSLASTEIQCPTCCEQFTLDW